ncbi:aldolase/citrate lyase family protein [Thalassobaculum sp.]|uniref:HpcH/HpaI aldolase family protein n=1 Tax=Thalassobaculum sp. TaxID=2022740 RepID=UPI0032EE0B21
MTDLKNAALDRLRDGQLALGIGLRQARTVDIAKAMRTAGFDWLFIDMEHNSMDLDTAVQISVAAQDAGITPVVRVPGYESFHATRALDGGAQGVVVPHVDDAATAARMVSQCRYPPVGHRSVTGALPQLDFRPTPLAEATETINRETLLVIMLESPQAIARADEIAAVPGVDALLIGTSDLSMEMGIPGQVGHPDIAKAYETVVEACRRHGKHPGMGGVYDPPLMQRYIEIGARLILGGNDLPLLMQAATERTKTLRAML